MSLSKSQFELVLTIFTLKRRRLNTADDKERDESDLQDVCAALEAASMAIVPTGVIEALNKTIGELNGKLRKANLLDEGAST